MVSHPIARLELIHRLRAPCKKWRQEQRKMCKYLSMCSLQASPMGPVVISQSNCYGLNCVSKKDMSKFLALGTCEIGDLFWKLVLCRCNQVKMWSYWVSVDLNPMTGVLKRRGQFAQVHRENTTWGWRQRLACCNCKPRHAKDCWWPPGAGVPLSPREEPACQHSDFGLPHSRAVRQYISVVYAEYLLCAMS